MLEAITATNIIAHHLRYMDEYSMSRNIGQCPTQANDVQQRFFDKLRRAGFKILGTGNFSMVFKHKMLPDKVIKICMTGDDAYHEWAKYCMNEYKGSDPIVPNVYYIGETEHFKFYILDELKPLFDDEEYHSVSDDIKDEYPWLYRDLELLSGKYVNLCDKEWYTHYGITSTRFGIDIHQNNVMQNSQGQWVLTDPLC